MAILDLTFTLGSVRHVSSDLASDPLDDVMSPLTSWGED
jgi:hypothetical protein